MGENTKIEWCDHTANIWWGCEEVSPGCDNCYARTFARSKGKGDAWENVRYVTKSVWKGLKKWNDAARATGVMRRVFVGSMMDIAEKPKPAHDWSGNRLEGVTTADIRERFFRLAPQLSNLLFLTLTKRPGNLLKYVPREWLSDWPPNVMPGTSPVNQETASVVVPQLLEVPARQRFLSCEPLLGAVDLSPWLASGQPGISWVICGGESGRGARPMHPDWARVLRDQCVATGVPYLFKQWGEWKPISEMPEVEYDALYRPNRIAAEGESQAKIDDVFGRHCIVPTRAVQHDGADGYYVIDGHCGYMMFRIGKDKAGRLLDGREWSEFPTVAA